MESKVQEPVPDPVQKFKERYAELLDECISRRKSAGVTKEFVADWLKVDRRKIYSLEKGEIKIGLLLRYADKFDIETRLTIIKH